MQTPHIHSLAHALAQRNKERQAQQQAYIARLPPKRPQISEEKKKNLVQFSQKVLDPQIVKKASSYPAAKAARQSITAGMTPRNVLPDLSITSVVETETESPDTDTEPATPVSLTA
jgi:hypothetical protein